MDLPSGSGSTDPVELPDPPGPSPAAADDSSAAAAAGGSTSTPTQPPSSQPPSRYESQKRRDWNTFLQYLSNHKPPLTLSRCSGAHVIEFLKYLDQFGKTKVHVTGCPYYGQPNPPAPCGCQLKQAWGSLDALIGRLRAAYEENGGKPEMNPFGARAVRMYLREVRESQAKARGIPYEKKRKRPGGSGGGIKVSVGGGEGGDGGGEGGGDGGDGGGGGGDGGYGGGEGGYGGGEGGGDGGDGGGGGGDGGYGGGDGGDGGGGGGGTGDSSTPATSTI